MPYIRRGTSILSLSATAILSACMSFGPGTKTFDSMVGKTQYGQVTSFSVTMSEACKTHDIAKADFCQNQDQYVWVTMLIGQRHVVYKSGLAVPKSEAPKKGDIIAYHFASADSTWNKFDHVAVRASQGEQPTCRWEGSHVFSGGVICEGWRWDKDYPPLAD